MANFRTANTCVEHSYAMDLQNIAHLNSVFWR